MNPLTSMLNWVRRAQFVAVAIWALIPQVALAQTDPAAAGEPNIWGNMPGAVILLVPLALGAAWYLGRELGSSRHAEEKPRREGAVSRALAKSQQEPADR